VINFPKEHRINGAIKHSLTDNRYKGLVRTVKNARRKLADDGRLARDVAPSYFVECLLYNVPNARIFGEIDRTYLEALVWLCSNTSSFPNFTCQNEITKLFGSEPEQWDTFRAIRLVDALVIQWNHWGSSKMHPYATDSDHGRFYSHLPREYNEQLGQEGPDQAVRTVVREFSSSCIPATNTKWERTRPRSLAMTAKCR
jgi:hypothetical protein